MDPVDRLRSAANRAGLDGFGLCSTRGFTDTRAVIEKRVAAGYHGGLGFTFARPDTSTDVRASLPWACTLVVAARAYLPQAGDPGPAAPGSGRIARFATEDHYRGLRAGLGEIAALLGEMGHRAEILVDDNRLIDRAAAVRAGVGWWGKSTMVLTPRHGPWLLLGSVATDADLPPTAPMVRDCGTCTACLPACPTGALVAPGVLDARLCLAARAQAPGDIPRQLREAMGDRIYGCDDCLDACPPGHRLLDTADTAAGRVDLISLLAASDRELLDRYAHWYIPRRNPRYLRRNALVALGNAGGVDAVAAASGYVGHADALLRSHAAWALGRLGGPRAVAALRAAAAREADDGVLLEIEAALGSLT